MSALEHSPVLLRVVAALCPSAGAGAAICRELSKYRSRLREEAFAEAATIVLAWTEHRADRQSVNNILMELDMKTRAEAEAGRP